MRLRRYHGGLLLSLLALGAFGCEADLTIGGATTPGPAVETPPGTNTAPPTAPDAGEAPDPEMPKPEADEPYVNLSDLHFAQTVVEGDDHHSARELGDDPTPGTIRFDAPDEPPPPPWSSAAGRRVNPTSLSFPADAPKISNFEVSYPPGLCQTPQPYVGSMTRTLPSGRVLKAPLSTFSSESSAVEFLKTVRARFPMYLPFRHPDARLTSGWFYGNGNSHRGQDFSRKDVPENTDPTFAVYASAAGVVVDVYWSSLSGNVVAVEHTAPTGQKYLSYYGHLRNGRTNDVANANAIDCTSVTDERCGLYKLFVQKFPTHLSWGDDTHTIAVSVGDTVSAGQFLGWAGNTGYGGAGWGLKDDGTPNNWRGNLHLHTYYAYEHPTEASTFVVVDPYGVYGTVDDSKCYDLLKDTAFDRLFAPFYPTFHGVPYPIVSQYAGYYTQMGWSPRTLDVHRSSDGLRVSGAFARGIPGAFFAHGYRTLAEIQQSYAEGLESNLAPRQTSVTLNADGEPRYSVLFRALEPGETRPAMPSLDSAGWEQAWNSQVLQQGRRVDDYYAYRVDGADRFAGVFTTHEATPSEFYSRRTLDQITTLVKERGKEGFVPVKVNAFERGSETLYAAMLRKQPGCWRAHWALSPETYQLVTTLRAQAGFRLEHVQAHGDPVRYSAVFVNPNATPASCNW